MRYIGVDVLGLETGLYYRVEFQKGICPKQVGGSTWVHSTKDGP